ncbi:TIGR02594 family protein [Neotabrizicola sp. sgz301269]|uniref:C40 family peptidase n=1 Tax=Neotabrizicola sp. sgz301269 TaxID=3276282 RepID=UPI00377066CF
MDPNEQILEAAGRYVGLDEWPGAKSNPEVEALFTAAGYPGMTDDIPWCAAFVGAVLAEVGLVPSGSLMARSYATWGRKVSLAEAMPGDVVVFPRGAPPSGHVAFLVGFNGDRVIVRGGNQGNKVSDKLYPAASILAIRRADPSTASGRAAIRHGDRGAMVLDLQDQLARLGYFAGKKDGIFGDLTRGAVLAFQADHSLDADGIVGNRTWAALVDAKPKPKRDVSADDLRKRGSETIKASDGIDVAAGAAAVTTALPAVRDAVDQANGILPVLTALLRDHWPALLVLALLGGAVILSRRIRLARVEAARSGADLSK